MTTENSLGLRALWLPTSAGRRGPVKIQMFAVAMGDFRRASRIPMRVLVADLLGDHHQQQEQRSPQTA